MIKNKSVLLFVILANKYGITTYIILEYRRYFRDVLYDVMVRVRDTEWQKEKW